MMKEIQRDELRRLVEQGTQLVEVLQECHLPGAIDIPVRKFGTDVRDSLDASKPVIVYRWDAA